MKIKKYYYSLNLSCFIMLYKDKRYMKKYLLACCSTPSIKKRPNKFIGYQVCMNNISKYNIISNVV